MTKKATLAEFPPARRGYARERGEEEGKKSHRESYWPTSRTGKKNSSLSVSSSPLLTKKKDGHHVRRVEDVDAFQWLNKVSPEVEYKTAKKKPKNRTREPEGRSSCLYSVKKGVHLRKKRPQGPPIPASERRDCGRLAPKISVQGREEILLVKRQKRRTSTFIATSKKNKSLAIEKDDWIAH